MTAAERARKYRKTHADYKVGLSLRPEHMACILYLRQQWGFASNAECVRACLAAVTVMTRRGLKRLDLVLDPDRD